MTDIKKNVDKLWEAVAIAALNAGRNPDEISILAASKYTDRAGVEALIRAGINLIGENRVQDAKEKLTESETQKDIHDIFPDCKIHFIGHLQTNKVNRALKIFDTVDTVDRTYLADALQKRLETLDRILPVLVEVKLTGEGSKTGCPESFLPELFHHIWSSCANLEVRGVMGMGPWDPTPEVARPYYNKLKKIFDRFRMLSPQPSKFSIISMGMSADFHVAIQEGATLLRIGRALFA